MKYSENFDKQLHSKRLSPEKWLRYRWARLPPYANFDLIQFGFSPDMFAAESFNSAPFSSLSVCPHSKNRKPLNGFPPPPNCILESFTEVCRYIPFFIKLGQHWLALYMKTYALLHVELTGCKVPKLSWLPWLLWPPCYLGIPSHQTTLTSLPSLPHLQVSNSGKSTRIVKICLCFIVVSVWLLWKVWRSAHVTVVTSLCPSTMMWKPMRKWRQSSVHCYHGNYMKVQVFRRQCHSNALPSEGK
jgi:hypothetical protein